MVAPTVVAMLVLCLAMGFALVRYDAEMNRNAIEGALPALGQWSVAGDTVSIQQHLETLVQALKLKRASILSPENLLLFEVPKGSGGSAIAECRNKTLIKAPWNATVALLCIEYPLLGWVAAILAGLLLVAVLMIGLLCAGFQRANRILRHHGEELGLLSSMLAIADPGLETEPFPTNSFEAEALFKSIIRFKDEKARADLAEKAHIKAASVAEFAAQVAHDLNSPVGALRSLLPSLEALPGDSLELGASIVTRISEITDGLLRKYREHLTDRSSEPQGAKGSVQIGMHGFLAKIVAEKRLLIAPGHDIRLSLEAVAPEDFIPTTIEHLDLARVLSNVIQNAIEAVGRNGNVSVSARSVGPYVGIQVEDDGCGMSGDMMAQLGQLGITSGKVDGTGLGIYGAMKVIRASGGDVQISSREGQGTRVIILLVRA